MLKFLTFDDGIETKKVLNQNRVESFMPIISQWNRLYYYNKGIIDEIQ